MSARTQFVLFRVCFGIYLAYFFYSLAPFMSEIFGSQGLYPNRISIPYPNSLPWVDRTNSYSSLVIVMIGAALALCAGFHRRVAAGVLLYGLGCLRSWNALLCPPSDGYVGWLLLSLVFIPQGEGRGLHREDAQWELPRPILVSGLIVFAISYTLSGLDKCRGELWLSGNALEILYSSPLSRIGLLPDVLRSLPPEALKLLTWASLGTELFCAPLCIFRFGRKLAWSATTVLHLGVLSSVAITSVSLAMLLFNLFLIPIIFPNSYRKN
ncbi:MAG: hypothetical protein J0M12_04495 [Deltaproteobacteria bacterium]|nr:hypothetical protein [Deltaproteobacteria bacterium]